VAVTPESAPPGSESPGSAPYDGRDRSRRVRRNAILLGMVAFAFYAAFILMAVTGVRG
jgi:hypothetical protein